MIGVISLSTNSFALDDKVEYYTLPTDVKDLAFKIESEEINNILKSKKIISKTDTVFAMAYWYKGEKKVVLKGISKTKREIKNLISEAFLEKASIVWGNSHADWIKGYKVKSSTSNQVIYEDPSGVLEKSEISISKSKNKMIINEKKPIGTVRTSLDFNFPKWSNLVPVLSKSSRIAYEGSRVLRTNIEIEYKKTKSKKYFPHLVKINSTQSVTFKSAANLDRKIIEEYMFSDYMVNEGIAKSKI